MVNASPTTVCTEPEYSIELPSTLKIHIPRAFVAIHMDEDGKFNP